MIRRLFLAALAITVLVGVGPAYAAKAAKKPANTSRKAPVPQYTQEVRQATARLKVDRSRWKMIVCHHSAIEQGNAAVYDQAHRQRGMENGLAYHFVIGNGVDSKDGEIEIGSRWLKQLQGGHVRSEKINDMAIGICLVGDFNKGKPTRKQLAALEELVVYLRKDVLKKKVRFTVHKKIDPGHTACPGRHFPVKKMQRLFGG